MHMIITIDGLPGSGKTTVAKRLAHELGFKMHSAGDIMREMAKERNMSLAQLQQEAQEDDGKIDKEIDRRTKELGEQEDNFVINGRTTGHFIPHAKKIFLDVEIATGARRIFLEGREDEYSEEYYQAVNKVKKRMASERIRYKQYYGLDIDNPKNYDLILDTTERSQEQVVDEILQWIDHGK